MRHVRLASHLFSLLALAAVLTNPASAQDKIDDPDITVGITGLACPFCAYGLEMRLKKLEAVETLKVHLEDGKVVIKLKKGADLDEKKIRDAVLDAGFTVTEVSYTKKQKTSEKSAGTTGRQR